MDEIEKINDELLCISESVIYDLPVRDDLFCINCKVPSVHHRLYPASIDCFKSGNDWHLTCKGTTIALIPPHVIKKIFNSLHEAYKVDLQNRKKKMIEIEMDNKKDNLS